MTDHSGIGSMTAASESKTAFQREVASRFGLVPNFFSSAPDAPEVIERLGPRQSWIPRQPNSLPLQGEAVCLRRCKTE